MTIPTCSKKINASIILSAGKGVRFKKDINSPPKQLVKIANRTLLEHTLEKFEKNKKIDEIILVVDQNSRKIQERIIKKNNFKKVKKIILGGTTRQESSRNGVFACDKKTKKVLIHDANRPFVSNKIINKIIDKLDVFKAVTVAVNLTDTLLKVDQDDFVVDIPKRAQFKREQTPQGFDYQTIKKAHQLAIKENFNKITDDCGLIKKYKLSNIFVIQGEEENIKITYPFDLYIANKLFKMKKSSYLKA